MEDCSPLRPKFSHTLRARVLEIARPPRIIFSAAPVPGGPLMKATPFEFRNRFWIFGAFFWIGFFLYSFDHINALAYVVHFFHKNDALRPNSLPDSGVIVAAALCFICAALRTWGTAYLKADVMQDASLHAEHIVADGPYRYMRNPLYLGGIFLALGMGLMMSRAGFLLAFFGVTIFSLRLIGLEESNLRAERGESYAEYCRLVPRIIPSLTPRVPSGGLEPHWGQAILGELFMWGFFAAVLAFALTKDQRVLLSVIVLSLALYIVRSYWVASRNRRKSQQS
jgi:protein-S-isoprenylcysteine O-methyltransferase Ste14